jgi:ABC-type glycerol-3-phosphate transport system permease component
VRQIPLYFCLLILSVFFLVPLARMLSTSLESREEVYALPPVWIPHPPLWDNYTFAMAQFPFFQSLSNTMVIIVGVEAGRLLSATMAAYAFARIRFPLRNALFLLVLSTMMVPYYVTLIPQYLLFRDFKWLDTPLPLIVPAFFGGGAFYIFLMRQFFMTVPVEMDDAARIDGAGWLGVFWHIILPMSVPVLGTVTIFTFLGEWNDFFGPMIYLNTPEKQTLAIVIAFWRQAQYGTPLFTWAHLMAVSLVITLPPIAVFFIAQRYFIQGIVISGLKG